MGIASNLVNCSYILDISLLPIYQWFLCYWQFEVGRPGSNDRIAVVYIPLLEEGPDIGFLGNEDFPGLPVANDIEAQETFDLA